MKNILVYLMLAATFLLSACDKDDKMLEPSYLPVTYANIAGTWQLAEWNGVEMSEGRYCYLVIKRKADEVIIGSVITMYDGFHNLLEFGVRVEDAVKMTSVNPAEIMKQNGKGMIIPGFDADLLIMDKDFNLIDTVVGGKFIREKK